MGRSDPVDQQVRDAIPTASRKKATGPGGEDFMLPVSYKEEKQTCYAAKIWETAPSISGKKKKKT